MEHIVSPGWSLCAVSKYGRVDDAIRVLGEMTRGGVAANQFTYTTLITHTTNLGRLSDALRLTQRMRREGMR